MRIKALVVAAAVGAGLFVTAGSASAICMEVPVLGCVNPCSEVADAYHDADDAAYDLLPNRQFACPR